MNTEECSYKERYEAFCSKTREEAIRIIKVEFPKKLRYFNELSMNAFNGIDNFVPMVDVYGDVVETNTILQEKLSQLQEELVLLITNLITVKFFIMLSQPKKEDGNNFGVEVQNEIADLLEEVSESARGILSKIINYYSVRGNLISKCRKNPHIADYKNAVISFDTEQMINVSHIIIDIRNKYALVYDRIMKNFDKIVKPKGAIIKGSWDSLY